ncbi:UNVERIFIED_CONTAM: hypothetical protein K2H54_006064, partial [Gekko kuhli]
MCKMQAILSARHIEWRDCLESIVNILSRLNTAEALTEKQCLLLDAQKKEEACKVTMENLRTRVNEEDERRLLLVGNRHGSKHRSLSTMTSTKSGWSTISHKSQQSTSSHKSQDTVASKRFSHKSQHTEASHKSSHGHSSNRHKTDAEQLAEAETNTRLAAKAAELAKREEALKREACKLQDKREDKESLCKASKADGLAARAELPRDGHWNSEPDFNPTELGVLDPSQQVMDYVQEQTTSVHPLDSTETKVLNPAAPEFMRAKTTSVFPPAPVPAQAYMIPSVPAPVPAPESDMPQQLMLNSSTATTSGEASSTPAQPVSTHCTQVFDATKTQRSCHQIGLAKVFPTGHPEKAAKTYIILDAQSNQSL